MDLIKSMLGILIIFAPMIMLIPIFYAYSDYQYGDENQKDKSFNRLVLWIGVLSLYLSVGFVIAISS